MTHTLIAQSADGTIQVFRRPGGAFVRCTQTLRPQGRTLGRAARRRGAIESTAVHDFPSEADALAFFHNITEDPR